MTPSLCMKRDDKSNKSSFIYTLRVEKYNISNGENLCYNCNDYGVLIRSNGLLITLEISIFLW